MVCQRATIKRVSPEALYAYSLSLVLQGFTNPAFDRSHIHTNRYIIYGEIFSFGIQSAGSAGYLQH